MLRSGSAGARTANTRLGQSRLDRCVQPAETRAVRQQQPSTAQASSGVSRRLPCARGAEECSSRRPRRRRLVRWRSPGRARRLRDRWGRRRLLSEPTFEILAKAAVPHSMPRLLSTATRSNARTLRLSSLGWRASNPRLADGPRALFACRHSPPAFLDLVGAFWSLLQNTGRALTRASSGPRSRRVPGGSQSRRAPSDGPQPGPSARGRPGPPRM